MIIMEILNLPRIYSHIVGLSAKKGMRKNTHKYKKQDIIKPPMMYEQKTQPNICMVHLMKS